PRRPEKQVRSECEEGTQHASRLLPLDPGEYAAAEEERQAIIELLRGSERSAEIAEGKVIGVVVAEQGPGIDDAEHDLTRDPICSLVDDRERSTAGRAVKSRELPRAVGETGLRRVEEKDPVRAGVHEAS